MELKDALKQIREERGLTKRELCEKTGISERAYLTYEFGEREPKIGVIQKLADFYGVSIDYILGRNAKEEQNESDAGDKVKIKEALKTLRKNAGFQNAKEFCDKIGISFNTYQNYESGKRLPPAETIIKIADFYNVSADEVLGRTVENDSREPDTLDLITNKLHLNMYERAIVAAYLALDTETRTKLAQTVKKMADKMDGQKDSAQEEMRTVKFVANNGNNREISITKSQESKIADLLDEIERNNNGNIW